MRRLGFLTTALVLVFAAAAPATAQASETMCGSQLSELSDSETMLHELQAAHEEGEAVRKALRSELFELTVELETLKLDGASAGRIAAKRRAIDEASAELAASVKVAPALDKQIEALSRQVADASRDYFACVESTID